MEVPKISEVPLVVELQHIDEQTKPKTGGKASNLTVLIKAGFNVPKGFVVTTAAYSKFIMENEIENLAKNHLDGIDFDAYVHVTGDTMTGPLQMSTGSYISSSGIIGISDSDPSNSTGLNT